MAAAGAMPVPSGMPLVSADTTDLCARRVYSYGGPAMWMLWHKD
ncbi:hypothetical protein [Sphingomonas sp.]